MTGEDHDLLVSARELLKQRQFERAAKMLQALSTREPAASALRRWAEKFASNPPASDWDGVFEMTSK
jgi:hypothetical protein